MSVIGRKENIMQRTVKGTRVNLAKMEIVKGQIAVADVKSVVYPNTPEEKAIKKAQKDNLGYGVISAEPHEQLYVLDDAIFFKYAKAVEPKTENTENA